LGWWEGRRWMKGMTLKRKERISIGYYNERAQIPSNESGKIRV
jgi:hypothetical protein